MSHAEYRIEPAIELGEEYNDNITLQHTDRLTDWITEVNPLITITYTTPFWDWNISYSRPAYYYFKYDQYTHADSNLNLVNHTRLITDFLFVNVSDTYRKVSTSITRDFTLQSNLVGQTDQNTFTFNPYISFRPTPRSMVTAGYEYVDVSYRDPAGVDRIDNIGYAEAGIDLFSRLSTTIGIKYTDDTNRIQDYYEVDAYGGIGYNSESLSLGGTYGRSRVVYEFFENRPVTEPIWSGSLTYAISRNINSYFRTSSSNIQDIFTVRFTREVTYTAGIHIQTTETDSLDLSYGLISDFDTVLQYRRSKIDRISGAIHYSPSATTSISLVVSHDTLDDLFLGATTRLLLADIQFNYILSRHFTASLEYRYTDSRCVEILANDYYNNRVNARIRWTF